MTAITYTLSGATIASGSIAPGAGWSLWTPVLGVGISEVAITAIDADGRTGTTSITITRRDPHHGTEGSSDGPIPGLGCGAGAAGALVLASGLWLARRRRR